MKRKLIAILLSVAMLGIAAAGCGESEASSKSAGGSEDEVVTLKLFSNLPDRKNGQGLIEQMIIDEYMSENEKVKIEVEALDEEAYKTKFKAYAMDGMPDVVSIWGQPAFLDEVLEAGVLAELNESDYADYKFLEGSLEGFKKDNKLYGLPRNTDVAAFYYNQKIFDDNGFTVPETYEDLLALADKMKEADIIPLAMDGGDGWPLAIYMTDLINKINGSSQDIVADAVAKSDFTDPVFAEVAGLMRETVEAGLFQDGYDSQDYGTAMNLFTNGQAAMFYMGSWETSMALNQDIPEEIRTNIRAFTMPVVDGGKGGAADIAAWNGGGYAVSADSKVKEEAIKFLNYMYQPDKLSKYGWENGVGMSAQDQSEYMTGEETKLQKQFTEFVNNATSLSGTPINDCGPSTFKDKIESTIQSVTNGTMSVDEFLDTIGNACK